MIRGQNTFDVFVRDWWRKDENGRVVPYPGAPRRYIVWGVSEAEARDLCASHAPGWRSRKAEYERA